MHATCALAINVDLNRPVYRNVVPCQPFSGDPSAGMWVWLLPEAQCFEALKKVSIHFTPRVFGQRVIQQLLSFWCSLLVFTRRCHTMLCPNAVHVHSSRLFTPTSRSAHKWRTAHAKSKSHTYKLEAQMCTDFAHTLVDVVQCYSQTRCTFTNPGSSHQPRDLHINGGRRQRMPTEHVTHVRTTRQLLSQRTYSI